MHDRSYWYFHPTVLTRQVKLSGNPAGAVDQPPGLNRQSTKTSARQRRRGFRGWRRIPVDGADLDHSCRREAHLHQTWELHSDDRVVLPLRACQVQDGIVRFPRLKRRRYPRRHFLTDSVGRPAENSRRRLHSDREDWPHAFAKDAPSRYTGSFA